MHNQQDKRKDVDVSVCVQRLSMVGKNVFH